MAERAIRWRRGGFVVLMGIVSIGLGDVHAWGQTREHKSAQAGGGDVARGKYLVEGVAMCGQCHTPRDDSGALDHSRWLEGAALWLLPARPTQDWPTKVPRIAGIPPGTDQDMINLLTTGVWKDGERLRPPMPQFRMSREDAQAVVEYLKSLNAGPQ